MRSKGMLRNAERRKREGVLTEEEEELKSEAT